MIFDRKQYSIGYIMYNRNVVGGCRSPVETSAQQKHRPSRDARPDSPLLIVYNDQYFRNSSVLYFGNGEGNVPDVYNWALSRLRYSA